MAVWWSLSKGATVSLYLRRKANRGDSLAAKASEMDCFHCQRWEAITPNKTVFVVSSDKHCVQKGDCSGNFLVVFCSKGSIVWEFQNPQGICVEENSSRRFIPDSNNPLINTQLNLRLYTLEIWYYLRSSSTTSHATSWTTNFTLNSHVCHRLISLRYWFLPIQIFLNICFRYCSTNILTLAFTIPSIDKGFLRSLNVCLVWGEWD